ncbi:MAG: glycine zipper domain-containing protein [Candidatus Omnitrophica bacterium]|nr:glycine zipper domain-containing protein [Candidatus Omnitrophota bacterium]
MFRRNSALILLIALALVSAGCESMGPKTKTGAVAGGIVGATAGGIIGYQSGSPVAGAAIGAAVGALGGGLIGSAMDDSDKRALAVNPNHLTLMKIAEMGNQGVPDAVIIGEIQRTHSVYQLNSETIDYLQKNKVSNKVIDYMLQTGK